MGNFQNVKCAFLEDPDVVIINYFYKNHWLSASAAESIK